MAATSPVGLPFCLRAMPGEWEDTMWTLGQAWATARHLKEASSFTTRDFYLLGSSLAEGSEATHVEIRELFHEVLGAVCGA